MSLQQNQVPTEIKMDVKQKVCVCVHDLLFVCTEIHSREHQPHKTPLPALEPLMSSKRDPCRALLLHTTPSPPGNAVPGVLKHTQTHIRWLCRQMKTEKRQWQMQMYTMKTIYCFNTIINSICLHLRPIGASLFLSDLSNSTFFR